MENITQETLGERIREAMNKLGYHKQNEFYSIIGVSNSNLSNAILGRTKSSQENIILHICVKMDVNPIWFYSEESEKNSIPFKNTEWVNNQHYIEKINLQEKLINSIESKSKNEIESKGDKQKIIEKFIGLCDEYFSSEPPTENILIKEKIKMLLDMNILQSNK